MLSRGIDQFVRGRGLLVVCPKEVGGVVYSDVCGILERW